MKASELIRDPVFQLNLLLWMAKEQPSQKYVVRPLFFECRFAILYIENPFPFPQELIAKSQASGLEISTAPEPELILGRSQDRRALCLEAKASSFSSNSATAKQARGHLLASGPAFAEVFTPLEFCLLCYVVPDENRDLMHTCLRELSAELESKGFAVGPQSCHGLAVVGQDLHYSWDDAFQQHAGASGNSAVVLTGITDETDPTPLFLVYTDEDYPTSENRDLLRRCMVNQVHAVLVCDLNALAVGDLYEQTAETLLNKTTDDVFKFVGRQRRKSMMQLVTQNVFRRIADFSRDRFPNVQVQGRALRVKFEDESSKRTFLDWLEDFNRTAFPASKPADEGVSLFDQLDEGSETKMGGPPLIE